MQHTAYHTRALLRRPSCQKRKEIDTERWRVKERGGERQGERERVREIVRARMKVRVGESESADRSGSSAGG